MPQITTWLIVSEQMSRLSEIWAGLVRKPPSPPAFSIVAQNLPIKLYASAVASQTTKKKKRKQKFKTSEINNSAREKNEVRCSPLCATHTPTKNKQ